MADNPSSQYDSFTIPGHWWVPGKPNETYEKVAGELHYDAGKLRLRLYGAFHKTRASGPLDHRPEQLEVAVIHGESLTQQPVTALNAFYQKWRPVTSSIWSKEPSTIQSSELHVHAVVVGNHVLSLAEQRYAKCRLQIRNLESWLDDRPFTDLPVEGGKWKTEYATPDKRVFVLPAPYNRIQITSSTWRSGVPPMNRVEAIHRANLIVEPSEPKPMNWHADVVGELERVLTLLSGKQMQSERQWLCTSDDTEGAIFFNRHNIDQEDYGPIDFLMRYPDIKDSMADILRVWLTQRDEIRHALDLYFSSLREPGAFLESRFLPMVQALEVYTRSREQQTYIAPDEYATLRPRIESAIPTDIDTELRKAIIQRLRYANEHSLRMRLKRLIESLDVETAQLFCKNPKDFIGGVVDTRNYLTHYSGESQRTLKSMDLHWATVKLRTMMSIVLLSWIGLPEALIRERVQDDYSISRERKQWADTNEVGSTTDGVDEVL